MRDAVICAAVRTPGGQARWRAVRRPRRRPVRARAAAPWRSAPGIDPAVVEDVFWGCVSQVGEQTFNIGRDARAGRGLAGVRAGHDDRPAVRLVAAGGAFAAATVISGQADVVVAGGVESMSRVPMGSSVGDGSAGRPLGPRFLERYGGVHPTRASARR